MTDVTALRPDVSRPPLPEHSSGLAGRIAASGATPGGAVFVLAAVLLIATIVANPNFGDPEVLIRFLGRTAPIAIAAVGQYYVIVSGEFDLSMGAVISLQVVLAGNMIGDDAGMILPVMALMFVLGALIGVANGLATTVLKVPSFIVTLGMMLALAGIVDYITGGAAKSNPVDEFRQIGRGGIEDVPVVGILPYSLMILIVVCVASVWLMRRPYGRTLVAAGDNDEAARLAGTSLVWLKTRAFVLSSLSATLAGILLVGYAGVHPSVASGLRVHRDHRGRARWRAARRRSRLGDVRRRRRVRARAPVHLLDRAGRHRLRLAGDHPGRHHHRRRGRRRPCLAGRPPTVTPTSATRTEHRNIHTHARSGRNHRRTLMRKTRLKAAFAAVASLTILAACGGGGGDGDEPKESKWFVQADFDKQDEQRSATFEGNPDEPWLQYIDGDMTDTADFKVDGEQKVCFANASISNPWRQTGWITMNEQLKALQDKGVISEMETRDAGDDDNTQIADIDYFISEGKCDAFVISPNSTAAMTPAVERACNTGKPVVVFDRGVKTDCATSFIHPIGGYAWGIDTANFLVENLEEGDKVVALRILPGVDVLETRWAAAQKIFEENGIEAKDYFTEADPDEDQVDHLRRARRWRGPGRLDGCR